MQVWGPIERLTDISLTLLTVVQIRNESIYVEPSEK